MAPPRNAEPLKDEVFDFVRKSETAVLDVGRKWADALGEFVPIEMPLVRDLTKQMFDFVDELLRIQREFVRQMLEETGKAVRGTTGQATGAARAPRTSTRAHKAA